MRKYAQKYAQKYALREKSEQNFRTCMDLFFTWGFIGEAKNMHKNVTNQGSMFQIGEKYHSRKALHYIFIAFSRDFREVSTILSRSFGQRKTPSEKFGRAKYAQKYALFLPTPKKCSAKGQNMR